MDLREIKALVETYGGEVADLVVQHREVHDKGSYIGNGKIQEAAVLIKQKKIDIVVLNAMVIPGQIYDMKSIFIKNNRFIEVWDRVDLILQIFAKHAHTTEAKLQIELAAMRHMGPRIYGMGMELSRQTGGIGMRGVGETNTELMKRHWHTQMKKVYDKLGKLAIERKHQLEHRRRVGLSTVSLVGYTNAGKTSLFNLLTKKNKPVHNSLFVTLDSYVGKVYLPETGREILLSDTIGFIKNLPTQLIDAFRSTLLESVHADLLLHVIDASDKEMDKKIIVVENILSELGLNGKKRFYVFNKIDAANRINKKIIFERYKMFRTIFISSKSGYGINELLRNIDYELADKTYNDYGRKIIVA